MLSDYLPVLRLIRQQDRVQINLSLGNLGERELASLSQTVPAPVESIETSDGSEAAVVGERLTSNTDEPEEEYKSTSHLPISFAWSTYKSPASVSEIGTIDLTKSCQILVSMEGVKPGIVNPGVPDDGREKRS